MPVSGGRKPDVDKAWMTPPLGCGLLGEFNRSSQHLLEVWRWYGGDDDARTERCANQWIHRAGPRSDGESIDNGSGRGSLVACRASKQRRRRACLSLSVRAGFANVVACHLPAFAPSRGATCPSSSVNRSPFSEPAAAACVRSLNAWRAHRPRSLESCAGTRPPDRVASSIAPPPLSGTLGFVAWPEKWDISPVPRAGIRPLGSYPASPEGSSY
jgi:hypothetical protein